MPIRTAEQAHIEIGHHFPALNALVKEVHQDFLLKCREIAHILEAGTRASIYRDIMVRKIREYCDGAGDKPNGAHFHRKGQLALMGLESRYLVRVKRLRKGFSVGVSPTHASAQYDANEMPDYAASLIPESQEATLLYLGWEVPENAPGEIMAFLVCNNQNRQVSWAIPLGDGDSGRGIQEELPNTGDSGTGASRVRIKAAAKRKINE